MSSKLVDLITIASEIAQCVSLNKELEARALLVYDLVQRSAVEDIRCLTPMLQERDPNHAIEFTTEDGGRFVVYGPAVFEDLYKDRAPREITHVQADGELIHLWTRAGKFSGRVGCSVYVRASDGTLWEI